MAVAAVCCLVLEAGAAGFKSAWLRQSRVLDVQAKEVHAPAVLLGHLSQKDTAQCSQLIRANSHVLPQM